MSPKIKDALGIAIILVILVMMGNAIRYVNFYSKSIEPSSFRSFSVEGEGKFVAVPDVAQFSFSVITEGGTDIAKIQQENTEKMNRAIEYVKSKKVDAKEIRTAQYDLQPSYQPIDYTLCVSGRCPVPQIIGYILTQSVTVKIRDFANISPLLSGVVTNGANTVSQLFFTIDDETKAKDLAREEAIKKAQDKAQAIAKATGFKVGRLLSIQENGGGDLPPYYGYDARTMTLKADGAPEATPQPSVEPGSQEVTVNVSLTYEIE